MQLSIWHTVPEDGLAITPIIASIILADGYYTNIYAMQYIIDACVSLLYMFKGVFQDFAQGGQMCSAKILGEGGGGGGGEGEGGMYIKKEQANCLGRCGGQINP